MCKFLTTQITKKIKTGLSPYKLNRLTRVLDYIQHGTEKCGVTKTILQLLKVNWTLTYTSPSMPECLTLGQEKDCNQGYLFTIYPLEDGIRLATNFLPSSVFLNYRSSLRLSAIYFSPCVPSIIQTNTLYFWAKFFPMPPHLPPPFFWLAKAPHHSQL